MKLIPLSQGKFALVDDEDYPSLSLHKWYAKKDKGTFYAVRNVGKWPFRSAIRMHNQILGIKGVDHKNRNGLDNQRENLRAATNSQNLMNCCPYNGRKFKGTQQNTGERGWQARIQINGKLIYLGYFKTEEEAAMAYDAKAREFFGEYARTNF